MAINASATCSGAPASLGVLRLRGGAAKAPRSAPSKKRGSAASGAGQPRRSAEGQGATEALDTGSAAPQHIYRADKRRGEDKRLAKTGKSSGSGADGKAASQAPVARTQDEAESATKASLTSSVVPKRPASQVVTGEYFRKKLRAADRNSPPLAPYVFLFCQERMLLGKSSQDGPRSKQARNRTI